MSGIRFCYQRTFRNKGLLKTPVRNAVLISIFIHGVFIEQRREQLLKISDHFKAAGIILLLSSCASS